MVNSNYYAMVSELCGGGGQGRYNGAGIWEEVNIVYGFGFASEGRLSVNSVELNYIWVRLHINIEKKRPEDGGGI